MNKFIISACIYIIASSNLLGQKTIEVFKDIWTFPPLEQHEMVHYLENDSLLAAESLKAHREVILISTSSKKGSTSIYTLASLAEKTAKEIGCNALSVSNFSSNGKADTLSVKFFSLSDSQLKKLCPTDPKQVTFINLPENPEKTILINTNSFHIGKGTYLSMQMQEEEIKISMNNGVFSKQSTVRLAQNGGRYFLIDAHKHLNIGQSNKALASGLVEVSQAVGEIMQHYLPKNGE